MPASPFALHATQVADAAAASQVTTRARPLTRSGVQVAVGNSKRMIRDALAVAGVPQAKLAECLGCTPGYVSRRLNDNERDKFTFEDVLLFPASVLAALADMLRAHGRQPSATSVELRTLLIVKELGELSSTIATTGADGDVSREDWRLRLAEANDLAGCVAALQHDCAVQLATVAK
jgi:hypothetical protein